MQPRLLWVVAFTLIASSCTSSATDAVDSSSTSSTEFVPGTLAEDLIEIYQNPELGFAIGYPNDWVIEEDPDQGVVGFYARLLPGDTFVENYNLAVVQAPADMDLPTLAQIDAARLARNVEGYKVVGGGETAIDGVAAVTVVFDGESSGIPLRFFRLLALDDDKIYEFTFTASREEFENYLPVLDQMLGTLRLQ